MKPTILTSSTMSWIRVLNLFSLLLLSGSCLVSNGAESTFADAVEKQDKETIRRLLARQFDVNTPQADGMTALHWAVYLADLQTTEAIVRAGAIVDCENRYGVTPLSVACENGNSKIVELLLEHGANANATLFGGETVLMTAARTGRIGAVRALLAKGAKVNARERKEQTALMWAAAEGHLAVVDVLLEAGADFRTPLKSGFTPLFFAVREGRTDVVLRLLAAGIDVNALMGAKPKEAPAAGVPAWGNTADVPGLIGIQYGSPNLTNQQEFVKLTSLDQRWGQGDGFGRNWSGRWYGSIVGPTDGQVTLAVETNSDAKVEIGDKVVLDTKDGVKTGQVKLTKGEKYPIVLSYFRDGDGFDARLKVQWSWTGSSPAPIAGKSLLHSANKAAELKTRYDKAQDDDDNGRVGTSPLILAVENGHFDLAVALLIAGADPNDQREGFTPLHTLSWVRKPPIGDSADSDAPPIGSGSLSSLQFVKALVTHGAEVNFRKRNDAGGRGKFGKQGTTPFLCAAGTGDVALMRTLLELGADPNIPNVANRTPLMLAAGIGTGSSGDSAGTEEECLAAVKYLIALGVDVNVVDDSGETAMHGAAYKTMPSVVKFLSENGADIKIWSKKSKQGRTPLSIAQGYRGGGNFKPSFETVAAIKEVMIAQGVTPPPPPKPKLEQGYRAN